MTTPKIFLTTVRTIEDITLVVAATFVEVSSVTPLNHTEVIGTHAQIHTDNSMHLIVLSATVDMFMACTPLILLFPQELVINAPEVPITHTIGIHVFVVENTVIMPRIVVRIHRNDNPLRIPSDSPP